MSIAYRKEKLSSQIAKEVSQILIHELKDPRTGFLTLTRVEMSDDYRYAKVFVSIMGTEKDKKLTMAGLYSAQGFVKGQLAHRLKMRYAPDITFVRDDSIEKTMKLTQLIDELAKKRGGEPVVDAAKPAKPAKKAAPKKAPKPAKPAKPVKKASPGRDDEDGGKGEEE